MEQLLEIEKLREVSSESVDLATKLKQFLNAKDMRLARDQVSMYFENADNFQIGCNPFCSIQSSESQTVPGRCEETIIRRLPERRSDQKSSSNSLSIILDRLPASLKDNFLSLDSETATKQDVLVQCAKMVERLQSLDARPFLRDIGIKGLEYFYSSWTEFVYTYQNEDNFDDITERTIVMELDLNAFKILNDSHGHDIGDRLIADMMLIWTEVISYQLSTLAEFVKTSSKSSGDEQLGLFVLRKGVTKEDLVNRINDIYAKESVEKTSKYINPFLIIQKLISSGKMIDSDYPSILESIEGTINGNTKYIPSVKSGCAKVGNGSVGEPGDCEKYIIEADKSIDDKQIKEKISKESALMELIFKASR